MADAVLQDRNAGPRPTTWQATVHHCRVCVFVAGGTQSTGAASAGSVASNGDFDGLVIRPLQSQVLDRVSDASDDIVPVGSAQRCRDSAADAAQPNNRGPSPAPRIVAAALSFPVVITR